MNHVSVEEVEGQPDAVIGEFLVKKFTAIVLFYTGASHSYISRGFVDKYKLPTQALRSPLVKVVRITILNRIGTSMVGSQIVESSLSGS